MERRSSLLLVALAGCGRVSFDGAADARAIDDAMVADASRLVICPTPGTSVGPSATISGRTFRYTNFDNPWTAVPTTTVTARPDNEGVVLAQTVSAADGTYSLSVPLGGQPTPVVLELSPGGTYFTTYVHFESPLHADIIAPAMMTNDVYSLGDGPVWDGSAVQAIYDQVLLTRDPQLGSLNVAVRDCAGNPVVGATIELDPPSELLRYQAPDGTASPTLTSTTGPFGHALAFNSPVGPTRIIARKDGVVVADQLLTVPGGSTRTMAIVRAAP